MEAHPVTPQRRGQGVTRAAALLLVTYLTAAAATARCDWSLNATPPVR